MAHARGAEAPRPATLGARRRVWARTPELALLVGVHVDDDLEVARHEAAGYLKGQYGMPLEVVERWTALGNTAHVTEYLQAYVAAGVGGWS